jgi:predicted Zn-dependent protease
MIALVMVGVAVLTYYGSRERNAITGEEQSIALSPEQEIALGLQSAPEMAAQFGGLDPDESAQQIVQAIGTKIVHSTVASQTPYEFRFFALADPQTVNAFALPGGPVFVTRGLLARLVNEAQLAGVLGHEVGHVLGRHAAEHIAKDQLAQSIVGAVGVASDDPYSAQQIAGVVANMVQLKYGREDELQADSLGVHLMADAGYDPRALIDVMTILEEASGGEAPPEYMSSHPNPGNRRERIQAHIDARFPDGVPQELTEGVSFGRS